MAQQTSPDADVSISKPAEAGGNEQAAAPVAEGKKPVSRRNRRKRRGWIVAIVVVLVLAGAGGWWWQRQRAKAKVAAQPAEHVVTVGLGDVEKSIESSGKVVPNLQVDIKCRASGEIVKLPFDISQQVKEGDLLCQLDPTDEKLAVRLAEATLAQGQAKLAQAKANLEKAQQSLITTRMRDESALASAKVRAANAHAKADRQKQLLDQQLGSQEEFETAQTDAATAEADLKSAEVAIEELKQQEIDLEFQKQNVAMAEAEVSSNQISLDTQKQQLAYTTVTSPMDGIVSDLQVQLGTIVASGTNAVNGGTTIMTLTDLSHVFVMATVDESDIGGVKVDQPAFVTVDSYPGKTFKGKVVRVAVNGVNVSNVVTFEVKVEVLDKAKDLLKPEMTGNVKIVLEQRNDVLVVPAGAVTRQGRKAFVTMSDGKERPVTLGVQGTETYEITSGLVKGDKILVSNSETPSVWRTPERRGPRGPF
jgi:multidrug resistance efflux pump